ncbi:MAG: hypothetical protein IJT97_06395 [Bacteroidaceae bacterium]|nr:hypothetical protein [Bacteroidaceae bacterium]
MKKQLLLILALVVASAMPNISMAATDYGIKIAGTSVTSDNADNVTNEYIAGGKISYDASTNTLTLKNVYLKSSNYNQIQILSNVKRQVKVMVEGYNKIEKGSGVSFVIRKPANSDSTNPDVYICGEGVLVLEGGGTIATVDAANVVLGESVNSEKCPLDIYANAFYSLSGGGNLDIFRANLHLTGFSQGTLYGFRYVYMNIGIKAYDNNDKPTYTYDKDSQTLVTSNGNKVTGNAYVGYEKYGLNICGKEVTKENRENIIVQSWIYKNTLSYDPYSKTLSVNNARLILGADYMTASEQFGHAVINNQIDGLTIRTTGECDIADLKSPAIYSSGSLNFKGSGELYIGGLQEGNKAIVMRQSGSQLSFSGLDVRVNGKVDVNGGKLSLSSSDVKIDYGIQNMGAFTSDSTEIATPGVFYDVDNKYFCKAGTASAYEDEIEFVRVSTYYGIEVCGTKVTDRNCANIVAPFMESGTLTYDPAANVLTLTDVTIDTKSYPRISAFYFIGVAHAPVTICLRGNNVIKKMFVSSSGIFCKRPSDATDDSEPHYIIRGNGSLTMEDEIECQGCNISFGDGTDEVPTINARNLRSFNDGEGEVWFNRCEMNLTGDGTSHTIRGFADIHTMSGTNINYPEGATYNTGAYSFCLMSDDGKDWREEVKIGGETYGLKVLGVEVNSFNKDNIVDGVIYNPSTRTLYMKDVSLYEAEDKPCIENTGNNLIIKCEGGDISSHGNAPAIYTTKSLEIQASSFEITNTSDCAITMAGSDQYIRFKNCDELIIRGSRVALDAEPENSYRLYVEKSNLTVGATLGHIARGISFYELTDVGISTEGVYIQPANAQFPDGGFCFRGVEHQGEVEFKSATTDFGIIISGHRLNDVNAKNFYFDDITSGEVSFEYASQYYWLTLSGVTAQCTRIGYVDGKLVQLNSNGINITASRPGTVHINLKGENTFNNIDGMGMAIFKDVDIYGDGTLNMGTKSIGSYNGADIWITDCTVNAGRVVGSNSGGNLFVEGANLHLTGGTSGQSAISKFENVLLDGCAITSPASCIYDPDTKSLLVDGSVYTGAVDITAFGGSVISVEDITALIDQYLESDSDITVEDITNLIDRYLEQ